VGGGDAGPGWAMQAQVRGVHVGPMLSAFPSWVRTQDPGLHGVRAAPVCVCACSACMYAISKDFGWAMQAQVRGGGDGT
jgi:hypothetical protein